MLSFLPRLTRPDLEYATCALAPELQAIADAEAAVTKAKEEDVVAIAGKTAPLPPCILQRLRFNGAFHIGDLSMGYIAARCRRLQSLHIKGCGAAVGCPAKL
jgi:hypothetical protein